MANLWKHIMPAASAICGVKPQHSRLEHNRNPWRFCHVIHIFSELVTSLLIRGTQMGEMSRLVWLIGLVEHAIWAYSLYFLYLLLLSISKILASSQPTQNPLHGHVAPILIFLEDDLCDWAHVHGAARLQVFLFRQWSSCHIHRECCACTMPSVADLFPAWFSWLNF
jgi:hypothetical protein